MHLPCKWCFLLTLLIDILMVLKRTGLLSNCEQMLTPMSSDKEGHLLGGFGGITSATSLPASNSLCSNMPCINGDCQNQGCVNGDCSNQKCSNSGCIIVDITTAVPTTTTHMPGVYPCGLL